MYAIMIFESDHYSSASHQISSLNNYRCSELEWQHGMIKHNSNLYLNRTNLATQSPIITGYKCNKNLRIQYVCVLMCM